MGFNAFLDLIDGLPRERSSLLDRFGRRRKNRERAMRLYVAIKLYAQDSGGMPPEDMASLIAPEGRLTGDDLTYELPKSSAAPWIHHPINLDEDPAEVLFEAPVAEAGRRLVAFAIGIVRWVEDAASVKQSV
jgi:hypothetical protein